MLLQEQGERRVKVGDIVSLGHFHGSRTDYKRASEAHIGVIKSIEEEPEPNVHTRCVEVQWSDGGVSWHFKYRLVMENEDKS